MRVLNLDPDYYSSEAKMLLSSLGPVDEGRWSREDLLDRVDNYEVLVLRFSHRIDKGIFERASRLKVIAINATGLDHIDLLEAEARRIRVISLKNEVEFLRTVTATAELTWGLLLSLVRKIPPASDSVTGGQWNREAFIGIELSGKHIGIIGLGRVGTQVATMARAFSMNVLAYDPKSSKPKTPFVHCVNSLPELLPQCDVISIHASLQQETWQIIGEKELTLMRRGAYFINTARGDLVNEAALLAALESKHLAGAALDVLSTEHKSDQGDNPLIQYAQQHSNLLITPHIGGATWESWQKTELFVARKVVEHFQSCQA